MADRQWTVVRDRHNHWGMVEVEGPALTVRGFTQATDVDEVHARKVEEDAYKIAAVPDLYEALDSIARYGSDTLSGRVDGPDDRQWQRDAVREMTRRARAALAKARGESNA